MKSKQKYVSILSVIGVLLGLGLFFNRSRAADYHLLRYTVDRTAVPDLYYQDVTLKIQVGAISTAVVMGDGAVISHRYDAAAGKLIVTTDASALDVYVADATPFTGFGDVEVTPLYDDKSWAWSQGFDDNMSYMESIDAYKALGYQATVFMIGEIVSDTRVEYWILDASSGIDQRTWEPPNYVTGLKELAELEWGLGNHGWGAHTSCDENGDLEWEVLRNNQRLLEIIGQSNNPTYKPIALAAPCFLAAYQGIILDFRDNGVDRPEFSDVPYYLQFNESGNIQAPYIVDSSVDYAAGGVTARAFSFNDPISRDYRIEDEVTAVTDMFDWMATNAGPARHFWYNTLAHGGNNDTVTAVLDYAHIHYGTAGSGEAWIAPSERIYSYLILRDRVIVTFDGASSSPPPEITPTSTPNSLYLPVVIQKASSKIYLKSQVISQFGSERMINLIRDWFAG